MTDALARLAAAPATAPRAGLADRDRIELEQEKGGMGPSELTTYIQSDIVYKWMLCLNLETW